ncbi:MAG TPA: DEAD/DEAH box helicase family protein, partial [Vicinamibacterales bacterium]|nr:DEAD/DEAH box helicase family protein [Vicinamibacterales bacterium]
MLVHVAVPVPGLDLLTYAVPEGVEPPAVGARVLVPLGSRVVTGIVIDKGGRPLSPQVEVKMLRQVVDREAFVPAEVVALARWTADYYAAGVGDTIPALLPPMARGGRADAHKTTRMAAITAAGLEALSVEGRPASSALGTKQREALELLAGTPTGMATSAMSGRGIAADAISRLAKHGYISLRNDRVDRDPFTASDSSFAAAVPDGVGPHSTRQLTAEQTAAFERLRALAATGAFRVALLHGVTGSGKTEIYVRLAAAVRAAGRRVLMLVPEIALTPAMAAIFREAFAERVAIQHSGLSDGERHDQWQR